MRHLLDVNALIALIDEDHPFHDAILDHLERIPDSIIVTCPITQNGFIRITSSPKYDRGITTPEAIEVMRRVTRSKNCEFWPDELSWSNPIFSKDHIIGPKQVTDVYLLALATVNHGALLTFDNNITLSAVKGATKKNLIIL